MEKYTNPDYNNSKPSSIEDFNNPNFLPTHAQIQEFFRTEQQWRGFFSNKPIYEFLNEEYLDALAEYIESKISEYRTSQNTPSRILEVGAGNGRLSHFLRIKLEQRVPSQTQIFVTDSGEWNLSADFPVEQIDHKQALEKYNPDIVIFSWMPNNIDCSKDFRAYPGVKEYILIGESDYGSCGDQWETWGNTWDYEDHDVTPYQEDGFERFNLPMLKRWQICRNDRHRWYRHSDTVSFRRQPKLTP